MHFIIIIIIIKFLLLLYICLTLNVSGNMFSGFGINKISQISRTFLRILAEGKMTVFCNSVTRISIPMSSNLFFSFFGVVPSAPIIIGMTVTLMPQSFFLLLLYYFYYYILLCFPIIFIREPTSLLTINVQDTTIPGVRCT